MPRLTGWRWWAGDAHDVEAGEAYHLGDFATRDEAVRAACREMVAGDAFYVIEARFWDRATDPPDLDFVPFARTRNRERLIVGPQRTVEAR